MSYYSPGHLKLQRRSRYLIGALVLLISLAFLGYLQAASPIFVKYNLIGRFDPAQLSQPQSFIRIQGNRFVDEHNNTFIFRGVNIADPDRLMKDGQWNKKLFQEIKRWGANVIRVPVHPRAWRNRGETDYLKLLDQAVLWANELNIYLIIDWHSIGYLETGRYQHPMYNTDKDETFYFWHRMAYRYQKIPTTALFEFFNEPTNMSSEWTEENWLTWKSLNEQMIDEVRAFNKDVNFLVAGFDWAYDLTPVEQTPIEREQVAYVSHPYPQKEKPEPASKEKFFELWNEHWGFVAQKYPVICTELGWVQPGGYGAEPPVENDGSYGPQIVEFMEARGISYVVWAFDPEWAPTMISNWKFEPTQQGNFFKQVFLQHQVQMRNQVFLENKSK